MITIDGSKGGQVLRYSLAMSIVTGKPFRIINIRENRPKKGIMAQHLHSIRAAVLVGKAKVHGDRIGSRELVFVPTGISRKTVNIDIPTAGSVTLAMQSILLPLLIGKRAMKINLSGGTDVPYSMPIDFFANVISYNLFDYAKIETSVMRRGFYPEGGGKVAVKITPRFNDFREMKEVDMWNIGEVMRIKGIVYSSQSMKDKADELMRILRISFKGDISHQIINYGNNAGIVLWALVNNGDRQVAVGYDKKIEKGSANEIAKNILDNVDFNYIDEHTADNIIPLMSIVGGKIRVKRMTEHMSSAVYVCERFSEKKFKYENGILECH